MAQEALFRLDGKVAIVSGGSYGRPPLPGTPWS